MLVAFAASLADFSQFAEHNYILTPGLISQLGPRERGSEKKQQPYDSESKAERENARRCGAVARI